MKRFCFAFFVLTAFSGLLNAKAVDFEAEAVGLIQSGLEISLGDSPETGQYLLLVVKVPCQEGRLQEEGIAYATLAGKRKIAGYVSGENIAANESRELSEVSVLRDGVEHVESIEAYVSTITIDVKTFLRGVSLRGIVRDGADEYVILLAAEKTASAADALDMAMQCEGPVTVKSSGFAPIINGAVDLAQKAAINNAKASAVEQVLGAVVASTEASLDMAVCAKVLANTAGFIKQFRIESESQIGTASYRVIITAEVAKDELMKSYASILDSMGDIRFFVACKDAHLRNLLAEKFVEWGCQVTDVPEVAQYQILCEGSFSRVVHPADGREGIRCAFTLRILDAASGKELLSATNDARKSVSFTGLPPRQRQLATEMAVKEIHGKIHRKLDEMIGRMAATGREVRLVLDNYSNAYADTLEIIRKAVEKTPGCSHAIASFDSRSGVAVVTFNCQVDMDTIRKFMFNTMKQDILGAAFIPEEVSADANNWFLSW